MRGSLAGVMVAAFCSAGEWMFTTCSRRVALKRRVTSKPAADCAAVGVKTANGLWYSGSRPSEWETLLSIFKLETDWKASFCGRGIQRWFDFASALAGTW